MLPFVSRFFAAALCLSATLAAGQATTQLWVQQDLSPPERFAFPAATPTVTGDAQRLTIAAGTFPNDYRIEIAAPPGRTLTPGAYEGATRYPFNGTGPGLSLAHGSTGCNTLTGRFTVLEAAFDNGQLIRAAIDFEHHCEGGPSATYGELRVNSTVPVTADRPPGWTTPDAFAFAPRTLVTPGSEVLSNTVTIYGINVATPISVAQGQYSINGGPFTDQPGQVAPRDRVRVLATAPGVPNASVTANLTVGVFTAGFAVSTVTTGVPLTAVRIESTPGDYISQGATFTIAPPEWRFTPRAGPGFSLDLLGASANQSLILRGPNATALAVGPYEQALRAPFAGTWPGLEFTGNGRGCNQIAGRFTVLEVAFAIDGSYERLAADFEQRCDGGPPLYGEVRYNSAVPFTFQKPAGSTLPDAFNLGVAPLAMPGQTIESWSTTLYGMNAPAPITIANGEYSLNGGPFTSAPGFASHRDRIRVRGTASSTPGAVVTVALSVGGANATFPITTYATGMPLTALVVDGAPGDWVTQGAYVEGFSPTWAFTVTGDLSRSMDIRADGPGGQMYSLRLGAATGQGLQAGPYEAANRGFGSSISPTIDFTGNSHGCNQTSGRFVILDLEVVGSTLSRLAVDFEQSCDGGEVTFGEIRIHSPVPITRLKPAGSAVPNPFAFVPQGPLAPGSTVLSNAISIYGINAPVPISIVGGEYSKNGGAFTAAAGSAQVMDRIVLRASASTVPGGVKIATFTAGATSAPFVLTTHQPGTALTAFAYRSPNGEWAGGGSTEVRVSPTYPITASANFAKGVSFTIARPEGSFDTLDLAAPDGARLAPGFYDAAQRYPFQAAGRPAITYAGGGCNQIAGRFRVHEAVYDANGLPIRFAADFEQRCELVGPPLVGQIRFNSSVPLWPLADGTCPGYDLDGDGLDDCTEWALRTNPFTRDNDVFADARLFAQQQYRDFLGREGDSAGTSFWATEIGAGRMSRAQVVALFQGSAEFQGTVAPVARLYFAYFNRIPDLPGLQFWIAAFRAGQSLESISAQFAASGEFAATYGGLDNLRFVQQVYRNVLGRNPDGPGQAFWLAQLDSGATSRGGMMAAFSESPEYLGTSWSRVYVTMTYVGMLRRAPDGAGFAFWVDALAQGRSALDLVAGFLGSAEYRQRFLP